MNQWSLLVVTQTTSNLSHTTFFLFFTAPSSSPHAFRLRGNATKQSIHLICPSFDRNSSCSILCLHHSPQFTHARCTSNNNLLPSTHIRRLGVPSKSQLFRHHSTPQSHPLHSKHTRPRCSTSIEVLSFHLHPQSHCMQLVCIMCPSVFVNPP